MPKRVVILLLALGLVLAACQPAANRGTENYSVTEVPETAQSPTAVPADTQTPTLESAVTPGQASGAAVPALCTVVSRTSQADPTQASLFPPVTEADWVEGSASARVTIIEYSDFQ